MTLPLITILFFCLFLSHYMHFSQHYQRFAYFAVGLEWAESFAELFYHGCSVSLIKYQTHSTQSLVLVMAFLLLSLSKLMNSLSRNECLLIR